MSQEDTTESPSGQSSSEQAPSGSKLLLEFGPLVVFFAAYLLGDIYWATGSLMVALALGIAVAKTRGEKIPPMTIFTGVIVFVFGGMTIAFQDPRFIKLKVTIINVLFGVILLFGHFTGRNFLAVVLGQAFRLDPEGWKKLTVRYACFFLMLAGINELVWRNLSEPTWVNFKFFGLMGLTLLFTMTQVPLLQRHQLEAEGEAGTAGEDGG